MPGTRAKESAATHFEESPDVGTVRVVGRKVVVVVVVVVVVDVVLYVEGCGGVGVGASVAYMLTSAQLTNHSWGPHPTHPSSASGSRPQSLPSRKQEL